MTIHLPPDGILRALTIREPFATMIVMGIKIAETRVWRWPGVLPFPCTIAIHASADDSQIGEDIDSVCENNDDAWHAFNNDDCVPGVVGKDYFYSQSIVGLVDVVGCIEVDPKAKTAQIAKQLVDSGFDPSFAQWCNPPYANLLANPRRFKQGITTRGQVKVWRVDPSIQKHCERSLGNLLTATNAMPDKPIGIAKTLGEPNYAELARKGSK